MILTASEAAKITANSLQQDLRLKLENISNKITKAAANGKFEIDLHEFLDTKTREYLQNQGYHIRYWRELNEEYVTIDWRK